MYDYMNGLCLKHKTKASKSHMDLRVGKKT